MCQSRVVQTIGGEQFTGSTCCQLIELDRPYSRSMQCGLYEINQSHALGLALGRCTWSAPSQKPRRVEHYTCGSAGVSICPTGLDRTAPMSMPVRRWIYPGCVRENGYLGTTRGRKGALLLLVHIGAIQCCVIRLGPAITCFSVQRCAK